MKIKSEFKPFQGKATYFSPLALITLAACGGGGDNGTRGSSRGSHMSGGATSCVRAGREYGSGERGGQDFTKATT